MMKIQALASGSNGNSIYLEENGTRILIDAGISCKRIRLQLNEIGTDVTELDAIFLTHEHSDHVSGITALLNASHAPVFATEGTASNVRMTDGTKLSDHSLYHRVVPYDRVKLGRFSILPVPTYHDAHDPVFYRVDSCDRSFAVLTDTGIVDGRMRSELSGIDGILLESNHDKRMLELGSYPYALKRRILSDFGHLSNESAMDVLKAVISPKMKVILLGHLSEENNYPDLVELMLRQCLKEIPDEKKDPDLQTEIAVRTHPSSLIGF